MLRDTICPISGDFMNPHAFAAIAACAVAAAVPACVDAAPPVDPQPPGPSAATCELHVWPGSGLNSIYGGWFHGGIVDGAVTGRDGYPVVPTEPVSTPRQVELLTKARPQMLLRQPDDRLVVHTEALASRTIRTGTARIDSSRAPCYAELIVDDVFFQQDVVDGSFLKVLFRYREFGTDAAPRRTFGTWVKTRLALLPPKPETDPTAAAGELQAAFTHDVTLFAEALLKPPGNKRAR